MATQRLVRFCVTFAIVFMTIAAFVVWRWPIESLTAIDKLPIKAALLALTWAIIILIALIAFKTFYVPSLRKYCTTAGSIVVGALLISPINHGILLSIDSASFSSVGAGNIPQIDAQLKMRPNDGLYAVISGALAAVAFTVSTLIYLLIVIVETKYGIAQGDCTLSYLPSNTLRR